MSKKQTITLLGGTLGKAARALGYSSVRAIYMWPDKLPMSTADRIRGAHQRVQQAAKPVKRIRAEMHATHAGEQASSAAKTRPQAPRRMLSASSPATGVYEHGC